VERGGHSFDDSEDFKKAKDSGTGLALTAGPFPKGKHGHPEIISGSGFIKVQAVHSFTDPGGKGARGGVRTGDTGFFLGCHGVGFSGVRKTRHGGGFRGSRGQGLQIKQITNQGD
jgi:hypothetical protein